MIGKNIDSDIKFLSLDLEIPDGLLKTEDCALVSICFVSN